MNKPLFLDQVRQAVVPASIGAELAEINAKLSELDAKREHHRCAAAALYYDHGPNVSAVEKQQRAHHASIEEIDRERRELRARRHALAALAAPVPAARATKAGIVMPKALVAAVKALTDARDRRREVITNGPGEGAAAVDRYHAKIEAMEAEIRALRIEREQQLVPYNNDVRAALQPLVYDVAGRLRAAAIAFVDAVHELREIAVELPPECPGLGNGLEPAAVINTQPAQQAIALAETLSLSSLK